MSEENKPAYDASLYVDLEKSYDKQLDAVKTGSTEAERFLTEPHDNESVNNDVKELVVAARESSEAYYRKMIDIAKLGLKGVAATQGVPLPG